jgi:ATP/maltotriose-dependent transcriptional regulator MalT
VAQVHWLHCQFRLMEETLERALEYAERAGERRQRLVLLNGLLRAALFGPAPVEQALERCEAVLAQAEGDLLMRGKTAALQAVLEAMRGEAETARRLVAESRSVFEELGQRVLLAGLPLYAGYVELHLDDAAAAERILREGYEALRGMGERGQFSSTASLLARALLLQGRLDEAEELTRVAEESAASEDVGTQALWRETRALVLARGGDAEAAEPLARAAAERAAGTDFVLLRGDTLLALSEVLARAGRSEEAARAAAEALGLYEGKGAVVAARRAREALAAVAR